MGEEDELMEANKKIEAMLDRNQKNREKFERVIFKIAYPLPPQSEP